MTTTPKKILNGQRIQRLEITRVSTNIRLHELQDPRRTAANVESRSLRRYVEKSFDVSCRYKSRYISLDQGILLTRV
jgi:hypothetical protein